MTDTVPGKAFSDKEDAGHLSGEDWDENEVYYTDEGEPEDEDEDAPADNPSSGNLFTGAMDAVTGAVASTLAYDRTKPDDSSEHGDGTSLDNSPPQTDDVDWSMAARLYNAGNKAGKYVGNLFSQLTPDLTRTHAHPRAFKIDGIPCHQWKITDETKYETVLAARLPTDIREQIERLNPDERTYAWSVCMHAADGPLRFMPRIKREATSDAELSLKFGRPDSWTIGDDALLEDAIKLNEHDNVPNGRLRINHSDSQVTIIDVSRGDNDNTVREFGKVEDLDDYYVRPNHKKYYDGENDTEWYVITLTLAETAWYTCRDVPTFAVYHPDHICVWKDAAFNADSAVSYRDSATDPGPPKEANPEEVVSIVWEKDSRPENSTQYEATKRDIMACKDVPPCAPRDYANHKDERWCLVFDTGIYFCPYENEFMKAKYGPTSHLARVTYQTMVAAIDNHHLDTEDFVELQSATYELGLKRAAKEAKLKLKTSVVDPIKEGVRKGVNSFVDNVVAPAKEAVVAVATDNVLRPAKTVYDTAHHVATTVKDFSLNPFAKTQYVERFKALAKDHWLMWGCATVALEIAAHHFKIDVAHSTIGVVALIIVDGINGGTILNEVKSMALDATTRLSKVVAGAGVASVLGAVAVGASPLALVGGMLSSATGIAALAQRFANNQAMWKALLIAIMGIVGPVSSSGLISILQTLLKTTHLDAVISL